MIRLMSSKATSKVTHRSSGFSLLETMIAVFIFAIGLLGYIGMQSRTTQLNVDAEQREEAMRAMEYLVNAININRNARGCYRTIGGEYATSFAGTGNAEVFACNAFGDNETRAQANTDLNNWDLLLKGTNQGKGLINARGCVSWDIAADEITVSIVWQGMIDSVDPDPNNTCGSDLYDGTRRLMTYTLSFADLGA